MRESRASSKRSNIVSLVFLVFTTSLLMSFTSLHAQRRAQGPTSDALEQLSSSLQQVVAKVSPAIVRVEVVGYTLSLDDEKSDTHQLSKSETIASGIIVEPNGYIVTNAHVVQGAQRVRVIIDQSVHSVDSGIANNLPATRFDARIVGTFLDADLALLKIDVNGLPVLPLASSESIKPGQLVLALGNPEGLNNSVSIGIVSAVQRGRGPDDPLTYIQTDAALNEGSSGGALVDIHGNLIGITTFILTESGGSEGLGFALPSELVHFIYQELKTKGHVEVGDIGIRVQQITPTMAAALQLPRSSGLIVADIIPDGPAEKVGVQIQDIILSLNGNPVNNPAQFATAFYAKHAGDHVILDLLRGSQPITTTIAINERSEELDEDFMEQPELRDIVSTLGIAAANLTSRARSTLLKLRSRTGVVVVGEIAHSDVQTGLLTGDLIRSVNGAGVQTVSDLRLLLQRLRPGDAVTLQIERRGRLRFLSFELD